MWKKLFKSLGASTTIPIFERVAMWVFICATLILCGGGNTIEIGQHAVDAVRGVP